MLHDDVINAITKKKFYIWAINKIEDGISILTGIQSGKRHKDGSFTKNSVFVNAMDYASFFSVKLSFYET